jgi:hypothetical protein
MNEADRRGLTAYIAVSLLLMLLIVGIPHLGSVPVTPWSPIGKARDDLGRYQLQQQDRLQELVDPTVLRSV